MAGGCCSHEPKFDGVSKGFKRALWAVITINGTMFFVEMAAGAMAGSQALKADALDFLGDTVTYAISLIVIGMSLKVRATAALVKGASLAAMGLWVFGMTAYQVLILGVPSASIMGGIGLLALAANLYSVLILMRFKDGDANVRSVWLCSRNDAIGNIAVMLAAGGVYLTGTAWPDLIVAGLMAGLFLWSALQIIKQAMNERRHVGAHAVAAEYQPRYRGNPLVTNGIKRPLRHHRTIAGLFSQACARSTSLVFVSSVLLGTIVLDQVTKWAALTFLSGPPYKVEVTPFFDLSLGFNTGVSFGFFGDVFSNQQWPLIAITIAIAVALTVWALCVNRLLEALAIALIAGGAFGNIIDRIRQGAVIDFLDFHVSGWHWPAFNFADVFIFVGAASLIILSFITPEANEAERGETKNEP